MADHTNDPLLYAEEVRSWIRERDNLAARQTEIAARMREVQQRLDAVRLILPPRVIRELMGESETRLAGPQPGQGETERPQAQRTMTELAIEALRDQSGGRSIASIRDLLMRDAEIATRIKKSPTGLSNALSRLVEREEVAKQDGLYYLPETLAKIKAGEMIDERLGNDGRPTYSSAMVEVAKKLGRFTAAQAVAEAKKTPLLAAKLKQRVGFVHAWLSREYAKGKLDKAGNVYFLPGTDRPPQTQIGYNVSLFPERKADA